MRSIFAVAILMPVVVLGGAVVDARQAPGAPQPTNLPFLVQVVADFESPWAMTFLPDGLMLVTEKAGTLYLLSIDGQQRRQVAGIPTVASEGQGGLLDVVTPPRLHEEPVGLLQLLRNRPGRYRGCPRPWCVGRWQPACPAESRDAVPGRTLRRRRRSLLRPHRVLARWPPLFYQRRTPEVRSLAGSEGHPR